jgi:hypothetical protein
MAGWHLAQVNVAYARGDEDDPVMAEFIAQLDERKERVDALPELGPGVPFLALWWMPAGELPTAADGLERLRLLGAHGPHPRAFTFKRMFTPQGEPVER